MTGAKDDDASVQLACSTKDVVLDFRDSGIVEVDPEGADDADESCLPSTRDAQEVVQFTAFAPGQMRVDEQNQAIHLAVFAPDLRRRTETLIHRQETSGRLHEATDCLIGDDDGIALRPLTDEDREVNRDGVAETGDEHDVFPGRPSCSAYRPADIAGLTLRIGEEGRPGRIQGRAVHSGPPRSGKPEASPRSMTHVISTTVEPSSKVAIQSPRLTAAGGFKRWDLVRLDWSRDSGAKAKVMFPTPQPATMTTKHEPTSVERRKITRSFKV